MSYCRFTSEEMYRKHWGPGGIGREVAERLGHLIPSMEAVLSDVYVYESRDGLVCCGCSLDGNFLTTSRARMIAHLDRHQQEGDAVPPHVFRTLGNEINSFGDCTMDIDTLDDLSY